MRTNELTGAALDWAVAKCEGWVDDCNGWLYEATVKDVEEGSYKPSKHWAQGGSIIEREFIRLDYDYLGTWIATIDLDEGDVMVESKQGTTPLIAAMRCYVASKLGDEIELPEELK